MPADLRSCRRNCREFSVNSLATYKILVLNAATFTSMTESMECIRSARVSITQPRPKLGVGD